MSILPAVFPITLALRINNADVIDMSITKMRWDIYRNSRLTT